MPRNLDRRVEAVTPIANPELRQQLERLLDLYLADDYGAWEMHSDGSFTQRQPGSSPINSQVALNTSWRHGLPPETPAGERDLTTNPG